VVGLDFTREMLDIGEVKRERLVDSERARASFVQGDAQALPFEDASFDVVSIAFGIRNVADPRRALAEFRRVLRPGGRLVVLEFATPRLMPVRLFNDFYCRRIMPVTATLISGDRSGAYRYLPKSVETFMAPAELCRALEESGFESVRTRELSLGICVCYRAEVPVSTASADRARG
jgi:demethylmenaquinone methyltransferase/2-methoxy-6-polyprenyl-1,4-benzoquinol methylase